jgi:hypothetical protein
MTEAANFYTKTLSALRLRELQTWTEIAREKNMIVVTGSNRGGETSGSSSSFSTDENIGALLGMIRAAVGVGKDLQSGNSDKLQRSSNSMKSHTGEKHKDEIRNMIRIGIIAIITITIIN